VLSKLEIKTLRSVVHHWEKGKAMIIDYSVDHEVWHNGSTFNCGLLAPKLDTSTKSTILYIIIIIIIIEPQLSF